VFDGITKLSKIAVTVPKGGFRLGHGNIFGKYHPFFSSDSSCDISNISQCLLSDAVEQPAEVVNTPVGVGASLTSVGAIVLGRVGDSCLAMEGAADLVQGAAPLVVDPAGSPQRAVAQNEMATAMLSQSGPLDKLAATREMEEKSTLADAWKIKPQVSTIRASTIQGECSPP